MRVVVLTNNSISKRLIDWLEQEAGEDTRVFEHSVSEEYIRSHKPDFLISYCYRHLIREDVLRLMPARVINLHTSYLPWNRGAHPNLWSFLENTPKGVSIHLIDKGIDTGDLLAQKEVLIDERKETLATSYKMLHKEIQDLFILHWGKIKSFQIHATPQPPGGSIKYMKDLKSVGFILEEKGWETPICEAISKYQERTE